MFGTSKAWQRLYPGAVAGALHLSGVTNHPEPPPLREAREGVQRRLAERYGGLSRRELESLPTLQAYTAYLRPFHKTYHVLPQVESIAGGKPIPQVAALVEAMFMAEVESMLLTAGHDVQALSGAVTVGVAIGDERYTLMRGDEQTLKANDMFMADEVGVISSVLYGPDRRTRITPDTQEALFTVYAPAGIGADAVRAHLERIREYALLGAPGAHAESLVLCEADAP